MKKVPKSIPCRLKENLVENLVETEAQRWYKAKKQFRLVSMIKKSLSASIFEVFGSKSEIDF